MIQHPDIIAVGDLVWKEQQDFYIQKGSLLYKFWRMCINYMISCVIILYRVGI
jgi:hypothetical protein